MLSMWAFTLRGKWILFRVPWELFLVAFAQATIWAGCLLDWMKYRLRLAARQHRPPTGHAGNEKEAKGQVSWTGKVQCKINSGNPSGHRCWRETAYDIITERRGGTLPLDTPRETALQSPFQRAGMSSPVPALQPTIRNPGLLTICTRTSVGSEAPPMPAEAHARTSHLKTSFQFFRNWIVVVEAAASSKLKNKIMLLVSWFLRSGRINACVVTSCSRERGTFSAMRNESGLKACGAHGKAWLGKKKTV